MRVAIYARVSSKNQQKGSTVDSQLAALLAHAKGGRHAVAEDYVCVDEGVSGATLARPGLDRIRDGALAGAFDAVLVLCPDRLSRKYAYLVLVLEEFERLGVRVIFLHQPPADDPHSALLVQIQGAVAEYERVRITERHRRGKLHRARQGEVFWTSIPLGYRRIPRQDGVPAHVVVDEEQAALVRKIFAWHADDGLTIRKIAKRLTESGHPPPRGGKRWGETTVHRILGNEAYLGTLYYNRTKRVPRRPDEVGPFGRPLGPRVVERPREEWIAVTIPALIRRETLERSRARREPNRRFSPRRLKEERWLLRRLLRCGVCDRKHACVTAKGAGGKKRAYYRCSSNAGYRAENPPCRPSYVDAASLDELVFEQVRRYLLDPRLLVKAHRDLAVADPDAIGTLAGQVEGARRRLAGTKGERRRLLDAWQAGFLEKEEFTDRAAKVDQRIAELAADLKTIEKEQASRGGVRRVVARISEFTRSVEDRLDTMTFAERQALVREVIEEAVLERGELHLHFKVPLPTPPEDPDGAPPSGAPEEVSTGFCLRSSSDEAVDVWIPLELASVGLDRRHHARDGLSDAVDLPVGPSHGLVRAPRQEAKQPALPEEQAAQGHGDREDHMAMMDGREDLLPELFREEQRPLLLAGWAEVPRPAGERHEGRPQARKASTALVTTPRSGPSGPLKRSSWTRANSVKWSSSRR
jgi:site-specific DNA recombinase